MTIPPNPHPEQVEDLNDAVRTWDAIVGDLGTADEDGYFTGCVHTSEVEHLTGLFASLANRPADDACDLCKGRGYWETAPGTCNPGGERIPCGKCQNITVTTGGQTWSGTAAYIGMTIGSAGAKNNRPQTANRPADDGGWIDWEPERNPAPGQRVEYRLRNADTGFDDADIMQWDHCGDAYDVVAYRVVLPPQPEGEKRP